VRDRRYDWLYERHKQPVREYLLERFAADLAEELRAWPPGDLEWESEAERLRWQAGAAGPPRHQVIRYALEVARLDLERRWEEMDRRLAEEAGAHWQTPAERAAGHLLVRLVTERCLSLKERAEGARLSRPDLVRALDLVERRLFLVAPA
jgi:hypothetical protein